MRIAVIPARGGSKRIPRKNIKLFCGKPMIAWSIAAAKESGCFDRIVVSTDDQEIARVAREQGADIPFMRPATLADDHTATAPVIAHAIQALQQTGCNPTEVCCIYATAPFLAPEDIRRGLGKLLETESQFVFPVTSFPFAIQRAIRLAADGRMTMFQPDQFLTRSQDLEQAWHDAGQFYWGSAASWSSGDPVFGPRSYAIILPRYRVQDIDTIEDWQMAEFLFTCLQQYSEK